MDRDDLASFLVGLGVGAVIGVLIAPQAGAETRGMLAERAGQGRDYLRDRTSSLRESAGEFVERGREVVSRQRDNLREAIDAGRQAYRETVSPPPGEPAGSPEPTA